MTKDHFMEQITKQLQKRYSDMGWGIEQDTILKNNDVVRHAVIICPPDSSITPTIYMDDYYTDYIEQRSTLPEIVNQICLLADMAQKEMPRFKEFAFDFDSCKSAIFFQLISKERNKQLLEDCPYLPFLDLAITFHVVFRQTENAMESVRITNTLLDMWQKNTKDLMKLAQENTPRIFPPHLERLDKVLADYAKMRPLKHDIEGQSPLLMLSNNRGIQGATAILYKDVMRGLAEKYRTNFYLIPSSIHEFLLLPEEQAESLQSISELVRQVNHERVNEEDILSDHAYFYNWKDNQFSY